MVALTVYNRKEVTMMKLQIMPILAAVSLLLGSHAFGQEVSKSRPLELRNMEIDASFSQSVVGSGLAYSNNPPNCDEEAISEARVLADQNAAAQCHGSSKRTSEYTVNCELLAHGYAARASVSADYQCE